METQLLILGLLLIIFPLLIGTLFRTSNRADNSPALYWIGGQVLLWAGFLVICVPLILTERPFPLVCKLYNYYTCGLLSLALAAAVIRHLILCIKKRRNGLTDIAEKHTLSKAARALWILFTILLLTQLVLSVVLAYEEGDDAYYIAMATISQDTSHMYCKLPYTGQYTTLDARHGLAPFPIWITYLAQMSGMAPVSVAQVVLAATMIGLAYSIYYLIAKKLYHNSPNKIPGFMVLVALLILFGGYSLSTAENFLLVRASQGKAVISAIIFPFLLYLFMCMLEKLQNGKRLTFGLWALIALSSVSACLCSTQGTILSCILTGIAGLCAAVSYRKPSLLLWLGSTCIIPVIMALLYFMVRE